MIRCWARQLRPGRTADQNTVPQKETTGSCFLVSQCSRQSGEASKILGQVWGSNTSTENPNRAGFPPRSYLPVHANIDTQAPHTHHVGPRKNHPARFLSNQLWATTPWWWGRTRPMRPQAKALWPFKRSELKKTKGILIYLMSIPAASQTLFVAKEGAKLSLRSVGPGCENQSTLDPAPSDHLSNDNSSRCNLRSRGWVAGRQSHSNTEAPVHYDRSMTGFYIELDLQLALAGTDACALPVETGL